MQILTIVDRFSILKKTFFTDEIKDIFEIFDYEEEGNLLLQPGSEGYRQFLNYFGDTFIGKDGRIKCNSLWRFLYKDFRKLRIFEFLMEPLVFNHLKNFEDATKKQGIIFVMPGFVNLNDYKKLDQIIWLNIDKAQAKNFLEKKMFSVDIDKFLDTRNRLYLKPEIDLISMDSLEALLAFLEKRVKLSANK